MKNRLFLLLLAIVSFGYGSIVVDPNCTVNFGAGDAYISGGLQIDLVKDVPKYPTINFDPSSRLYFVGDGDADLTNVYILHNVTVDKPSGDLYLNTGLTITGNLDFSSGNIITGANTVALDPTLNGNLSNESASSYVIGTVVASRLVATGTSTFGGIGFSINNTGLNLGTVTITRQAGPGNYINIYGSNGIERKWTVGTSIAFSGTRSVTTSWLSNEDNGNVLGSLKAWKYEAAKSTPKTPTSDENISIRKKISLKTSSSKDSRSEREFSENLIEEDIFEKGIDPYDPKTLGWVEVDGAVFNTASSPRTSTFTINAATIFTINDAINAFADGSGTEANPYQIATLSQLDNVRNYLSACFLQIADIDATPTTTWNAGLGWLPLGDGTVQFTGKYNGQHYFIDGLFINRATSYNGLFGYTVGSEISNVELTNVDITGSTYSGGLIGYHNTSSVLTDCKSEGSVFGTLYVGGLVGFNRNSSIINNSFCKGTVEGTTYVGGLTGLNYATSEIYDSYSYSDVTRTSGTNAYIAGFTSYNYSSKIINSYSTGSVVYADATNPSNKGFVAYISTATGYEMTDNFWNVETSGQTSTSGTATGLTTNEMRTLATFTDATWDFQDEDINGTEYIWGMNYAENNAFPFLSWQGIAHDPISGFTGGMGTESEPFLISNLTELDNVRNFLSGYYFLQTADIDASETTSWNGGNGWVPIGASSPYFTGDYDGDNHKISDLYFDSSLMYTGLFGVAYTNSVIKNLGLVDIDANGGTQYSGTISGYSNGEISNCFVTGTIRSNSYIGGFLGFSANAVISDCYSKVNVTRITGNTGTYIAGFVGNSTGTLQRCYSTGAVHYEGVADPINKGFAGASSGTITDSFWDIESSGQTTSAGTVTGKTTADMQNVATYTSTSTIGLTSPWDFVNDPNDDVATNDYWNIHASLNGGYPYFEWEGRIPVLAPGNLALVYSAGDVTLTWDAVADATGYAVYSLDDPYGTFILDGSGAFNGEEWTVTTADAKMFYFVTATNATKEIPKVIKMNSSVVSK
ncbi:MAG: hypothetical protein PF638_14295 [Candidatus Delongbacteria bacterium]|jgi:hypothetical protein|nr:hypothetical protein [Candidatus Delongbacteria bacterium]